MGNLLHARSDYGCIVDTSNRIPYDEPVFLFRAQDRHFIAVLRAYRRLLSEDRMADARMIQTVDDQIMRAESWQKVHKVKSPDMPKSNG